MDKEEQFKQELSALFKKYGAELDTVIYGDVETTIYLEDRDNLGGKVFKQINFPLFFNGVW